MLNNWWPGTWNTRVIFSIPRGCSTHSMLEEKTELTAFSCHVTVTYKCFALCMNSCLWFQKRWDSIPFLSKFRHIQRANIQCTLSRYRHVPETASTKVNFETKCAPWIPNVLGMSEKQQHSRFRETEAMCSPIDMQGEVQTASETKEMHALSQEDKGKWSFFCFSFSSCVIFTSKVPCKDWRDTSLETHHFLCLCESKSCFSRNSHASHRKSSFCV